MLDDCRNFMHVHVSSSISTTPLQMIVWLASFPRSGNTLLRTVLRQVFGLYSYSIYNDMADIGTNHDVRYAVGHLYINGPVEKFCAESMSSPEFVPVKTHEPPTDSAPAIYVVRDGRATLVSHWNYMTRVRRRHGLTMDEVIRGTASRFGSWSNHIQKWAPSSRSGTLLLRYEDLVENTDASIARVSAFLGRQPVARWQNNFEEMHSAFPAFFNAASNAKNIEQMGREELELFWSLHGDCMKALEYAR